MIGKVGLVEGQPGAKERLDAQSKAKPSLLFPTVHTVATLYLSLSLSFRFPASYHYFSIFMV